jgi:hypothetical protein
MGVTLTSKIFTLPNSVSPFGSLLATTFVLEISAAADKPERLKNFFLEISLLFLFL